MRKSLNPSLALAAAALLSTGGLAFGQGGGPATVGGRIGTTNNSSLVTAPNNLEQKANEQAEANRTPAANTAIPGINTAAPGGNATVPNANTGAGINTAIPGSTQTPASTAGIGNNTAAPTNYQGPGTRANQPGQPSLGNPGAAATGTTKLNEAGLVNQPPGMTGQLMNQPATAGTNTGYNAQGTTANAGTRYTPGLANPGEWNYRSNAPNTYAPRAEQGRFPGSATGATPGYTGEVMPGMGGYNAVNPMGTTMAPFYYYARTAGMPYATYNSSAYNNAVGAPMTYGATTAYPSAVMSPGYNATQIQPYGYQRRGLFGRRRVSYPASPYSYPTSGYSTYGSTGYYTGPGAVGYRGTSGYGSSYLTPSTYTYSPTTYTTPGNYSYTNGAYPY